jgi:hypothetical protein
MLNRKDLIEHKVSATPANFFNRGCTRTYTDWDWCDDCPAGLYTFFLCGLHGQETNAVFCLKAASLLAIFKIEARKRAF